MNSSKVFKGDTLFTPHSLIRHNIVLPAKEPDLAPNEPGPVLESVVQEEEQLAVSEAIPEPEPPPPLSPVDVEAISQEAYNRGAADSAARLQAELEQMQMEFEQTMRSFGDACQQIETLHAKKLTSSHGDQINLVIALTELILGQELTTPRNHIASTLQRALEQAISSEEFHVTLHPDDLTFAEEKAPALVTATRGLEHLVFKTDPSIRRGGCLLESVNCTVDATIEGRLESVKELLEEHPTLLDPSDEGLGQIPDNDS
ncbi:MAG: FliH/SctL family protein [Desulfobulbus sp.]